MGEPAVQVEVIREQELAEIRGIAPVYVFQEQVKGGTQIRGNRPVESREPGRIFGQVGMLLHLQPLQEERAKFRTRSEIRDHALCLAPYLLGGGKLVLCGSV